MQNCKWVMRLHMNILCPYTPLSRSATVDCVRTKSGCTGIRHGVVLQYSVLSEDYKQAWPTIIAALISVETTNEIKVLRIYLLSTLLRMTSSSLKTL